MEYVSVPGIVPDRVEDRKYQSAIARVCLGENTLVILPTGLGKTTVALLAAVRILAAGKKVLMMAPTKPLVDQHMSFFGDNLDGYSVGEMNGTVSPEKRKKILEENSFVVATPQTVSNDLDNCAYDLTDFGLVIYDEAHRGVGGYAYVNVARYVGVNTVSMGMTASPGSDIKKIEEVCFNLGLSRIEVRTDSDPDVAPYVFDTYVKRVEVNLPKDLTDISALLKSILNFYFDELSIMHLTNPNWPPSRKHMLYIGRVLQERIEKGERTAMTYRGLTVQSICLKVLHAVELAETQCMSVLRSYLDTIVKASTDAKGSRADKELVKREEFQQILFISSVSRVEHPKISRVMSLVSQVISESPSSKVIVFAQYRESCDILVEKLSRVENAKVCKLIGQANGGLKQKEQIALLDRFRAGEFNVVVSTSVGEEGLDISSTDAVIFYEPVPSEIRTIQRRGRTGRKNDGQVYVLVGKDSLDEVMEESAKKKEQAMKERLEQLSADMGRKRGIRRDQTSIDSYF